MTIVSHYGVHYTDDGVAYLEQRRGGTNAKGLPSKSPFQVKPALPGALCNHLIPLNVPAPAEKQRDFISSWLNDELLKAMAPIPRTNAKLFYLLDSHDSYATLISLLSKMSSPIEKVSFRADEIEDNWLLGELAITNVQPLIIRQCAPRHSDLLVKLTKLSLTRPRTVLLLGDGELGSLEGITRITSDLLCLDQGRLMLLPWESIGAMFLRSFMRGEWDGGWISHLPLAGDRRRPPRANPSMASNLPDVIAKGEGQRVEFKGTFQYCLKEKQASPEVRDEIPATVAAFMNSDGGRLFIGVADDGSVIGIEPDLSLVTKKSWDQLQLRIVNTLTNAVGNDHARRFKITKVPFEDKSIIKIDVERSTREVFAKLSKGTMFFVRVANRTQKLEGEEMVKYIKDQFPQ